MFGIIYDDYDANMQVEKEKKKILIVISTKDPNQHLIDNINNLYSIQISNEHEYKICIIDSDSSDFTPLKL